MSSRGWDTVPLFSNLAKTTYGFGEWPWLWGNEPIFVSIALVHLRTRDRNESIKALFVCLCICVHGWRLANVHISVYT